MINETWYYRFEPESFDLIVCYDVLEHLADPQAAIQSFISSIKRGGYIVIGAPDPHSLKGAITKYSPHALHVLFNRYIGNDPNAGKPGYAPFPTTLKYYIAPDNLAKVFKKAGFELVYLNSYDTGYINLIGTKSRILGRVLERTVFFLKRIFGGRYNPELSDFHLIVWMPDGAK
jgi:2-polyprenyl-3-methyl-5-hydroxy-6-metoxy-1,4-benzoquinol methylase